MFTHCPNHDSLLIFSKSKIINMGAAAKLPFYGSPRHGICRLLINRYIKRNWCIVKNASVLIDNSCNRRGPVKILACLSVT